MAQICSTIEAFPSVLKTQLEALAVTGTLQIVEKSSTSRVFLVVYDDSASVGQSVELIIGTPEELAAAVDALIGGGAQIDIVMTTFSHRRYIVVHR